MPSARLFCVARIGMDRSLGLGLEFASAFQDTHLGRVGRIAPRAYRMGDVRRLHHDTRTGWDTVAATKYRDELAADLGFLRGGGHTLLPVELELLRDHLASVRHAVHLQCSHGQDALGLVNLGIPRITGVDISPEMIRLAEEKSAALGVDARWECCDVLDTPHSLDGSADLVMTGKGALPWVLDLDGWAAVVARLLAPGGLLYLFEGHPLAALWDRDAPELCFRADTSGYFAVEPAEHPGFPADAVRRLAPEAPLMRERQWRPGQVLHALLAQGLRLEHFDEYPGSFWPQFPHWRRGIADLVPLSYAVLARRPVAALAPLAT